MYTQHSSIFNKNTNCVIKLGYMHTYCMRMFVTEFLGCVINQLFFIALSSRLLIFFLTTY